jgi:hypothetical protein
MAVAQALVAGKSKATSASTVIFIFAALALLSLLFAFGTPLYALLFYGLPGWSQLHSPFRWIYPFTLSVAVLAGLGAASLDRWVSARPGAAGPEASRRPAYQLPAPSWLGRFSLSAGWLLFWSGAGGVLVMLIALVAPAPFIQAATFVFDRSGLAQNAFASGRQFFGYQWPNFLIFFVMVMAAGAVLRIARCPGWPAGPPEIYPPLE